MNCSHISFIFFIFFAQNGIENDILKLLLLLWITGLDVHSAWLSAVQFRSLRLHCCCWWCWITRGLVRECWRWGTARCFINNKRIMIKILVPSFWNQFFCFFAHATIFSVLFQPPFQLANRFFFSLHWYSSKRMVCMLSQLWCVASADRFWFLDRNFPP